MKYIAIVTISAFSIMSGCAPIPHNEYFSHRISVVISINGLPLAQQIMKHHGFEPHVLVFGVDAIEKAMAVNPFAEAEADPSSFHLGFLASISKNHDLQKLNSLRKENERFHLSERVFYLHAPEGVGRSKLAANVEKLLGVPMTDRNWRTVCKIKEMSHE